MKLAYVIGPYRSPTVHGISRNIEAASAVAADLWRAGYAVICPHKNTAFFDGLVPDEIFLAGCIAMLRKCDFAVTVDGWEKSSGSISEVEFCRCNGISVFRTIADAVKYGN